MDYTSYLPEGVCPSCQVVAIAKLLYLEKKTWQKTAFFIDRISNIRSAAITNHSLVFHYGEHFIIIGSVKLLRACLTSHLQAN